jgi:hypothetical protein
MPKRLSPAPVDTPADQRRGSTLLDGYFRAFLLTISSNFFPRTQWVLGRDQRALRIPRKTPRKRPRVQDDDKISMTHKEMRIGVLMGSC